MELTKHLLNALSSPAYLLSADGKVAAWNDACAALTGVPAAAVVGTDGHRDALHRPRTVADEALESGRAARANAWVDMPGGGRRCLSTEAAPVVADGGCLGALEVISDVTDYAEINERLEFMASYDALTGLPNRVIFDDRAEQLVARAERGGKGFAVAMLDIDDFKIVNDALGHRVGDALLKEAAGRLAGGIRGMDTVARQGGDSFVILLSDIVSAEDAARAARGIIENLGAACEVDGRQFRLRASVGIGMFPADARSVEELFRCAETAMYHAKGSGKNCFRFFSTELTAKAMEALELESSVKDALEKGEFFLEYQPQLSLVTGAVVGAEALVRWNHPTKGRVGPDKFIPVAERNGSIKEIGAWVLREAGRVARREGVKIAVNVSAVQLCDPEFIGVAAEVVGDTGASLLSIEVTESAFLGDFAAAEAALAKLKSMGLTIALDDFGTGYSSLSYVRRLPIDYIKIDKSFVSDPGAREIVLTVINMAEIMGMSTIAEGVETEDERAFLERNGCHAIQGYLYSRPISEQALAAFLEASGRPHPGLRVIEGDADPGAARTIAWSPALSVGIDDIDHQHHRLFEATNRVALAADKDELVASMAGLAAVVDEHFSHEEALMSLYRVSDTERHVREHAAMRRKMCELQKSVDGRNVAAVSKDVAAFVADWIVVHTIKIDKKFSRELLSLGYRDKVA
jgi:diguanylate cyclase (GGDEF)-like protein/hemerythrin-like metal-binding protein